MQAQYTTLTAGVSYLTVGQYARAMNSPESTVRRRCAAGEVPGAVKDGKQWRIPVKFEEARDVEPA